VARYLSRAGRSFAQWGVTPDARWDEEPTRFRYEDVTRVEVGDGYATALFRLARESTPDVLRPRLSRFFE
jgi:hypothetical protein